jgi:hypothetical protein
MEKTDEWAKYLSCPIIYVDSTNPIDETIGLLLNQLEDY